MNENKQSEKWHWAVPSFKGTEHEKQSTKKRSRSSRKQYRRVRYSESQAGGKGTYQGSESN